MKKLVSLLLTLAIMLTLFAPPVYAESLPALAVSSHLVSMTEAREIDVAVTFDYVPKLENLEWTFGGKPLADWTKWIDGSYSKEPFITFSKEPYLEGKTVKATIKFDLVYWQTVKSGDNVELSGLTDLSNRTVRVRYPDLLGTYRLEVKDTSTGATAQAEMKLNVYDSYHTYDELKPAVDEIFAKANPDRYLEYQVIGQSVEGRDFHFIILAKDRESVDEYLNKTVPMMLEKPALLQKKLELGVMGDYKVVLFVNNIHPDEAPGIDAQLDALKLLTTQDTIEFKTTNEEGNEEQVMLDVDELLEHVIVVMNLTENPDGRYYNTRQNANGFDVNRDNGYQTQVESRIVVEQIAKWNPISFLDLHGFVKGFLIEPCTPPHDPNYEYDLLLWYMLEQANQMGRAGVANSKYEGYVIPYKDYGDGWDDGAPAYTATYAMHHGALAHTIEMPELNQDSNDAVVHAILASAKFILDNKDKLFMNQLEYFRRGVEGIDARSVDELLVNAKGEPIGRPRRGHENFFPEYYVLPVDKLLQKNPLQVYQTVEYLLRNGIKVEKTTLDTKVDGITYPAGSFVVNMHQAKRGLANTVLYQGYDASDFGAMYAEIVMNFPALRGFDVYEVRVKDAFLGKTEKITEVNIPKTEITGNASYYIIHNTNNDAIRAVNRLLSEGKKVEFILDSEYMGDFIVSCEDLKEIAEDYFLEVSPFEGKANTKVLVQPKVLVTGSADSRFVLRELGFEIADRNSANVIVDDAGKAKLTDIIMDGKGYVGTGVFALGFVEKLAKISEALKWFDYEDKDLLINPDTGRASRMYYEGLLRCILNTEHPIAASYEDEESLYLVNASYISPVPSGVDATVLAMVDDEDFFVAGWMPPHDEFADQVLAVAQDIGPANIAVFANTLVNKAHPQNSFRLLANAIYYSLPEADEAAEPAGIGLANSYKN